MKLPRLTGKEVARLAERIGFKFVRQKGSHMFYEHPDGRKTSIPNHPGEELGPGLLNKIIKRDMRLSREELQKLL